MLAFVVYSLGQCLACIPGKLYDMFYIGIDYARCIVGSKAQYLIDTWYTLCFLLFVAEIMASSFSDR